MCVYQEHKGSENFSPATALGRRYVSIRQSMSNKKTHLSAYWVGGKQKYLTVENMSAALEFASTALNYPGLKGIPVDIVYTHYLRGGGSNELSLAGYRNGDMQKKWRCRGETFMEYIWEELLCFAGVVSTAMKQDLKFINITGGEYSELVDVTRTTVVSDYQPATEAA